MDDALRRSAAHVLVADLAVPDADDASMHHLRTVLRLRDGEVVTVTDGAGRWRACRLVGSRLDADGDVVVERPPSPPITVYVAMPKGDRAEWLVQKCTEVGVDRIVVITSERSVVRWDAARAPRQLERLQRIATEAAMQSRRVWLPELCGPLAAERVLGQVAVAEPSGRPLTPTDSAVAIGPEGGWSPDELARSAGHVSLGPNILRVETAAVVAVTLMVTMRDASP